MSDNTQVARVVKFGDREFSLDAMPVNSLVALAQRGLTHYLGNEQASKVSTRKAKFAEENGGAEPDEATLAGWKAEYIDAAIASMLDGNIGSGSRGPRGTQLDTIIRRIAESEMKANLKAANLTMPSGKETLTIGGQAFTRNDLITRRVNHPEHGPRIRKAAEKELAALAKQTAKAAESGDAASVLDL